VSDNHGVPILATDNLPDAALRQAGDALMRRRQWAEAASTFALVADRDAAGEMKRRLCANLASLAGHRPDVYATLVALPAQQEYTVAATASGKPTIVHRGPDGATVSLSSGHDPLAAAAAAKQQIYSATKSGEAGAGVRRVDPKPAATTSTMTREERKKATAEANKAGELEGAGVRGPSGPAVTSKSTTTRAERKKATAEANKKGELAPAGDTNKP